MTDIDGYGGRVLEHRGWIAAATIGAWAAVVPLGAVAGQWVGCGPDPAGNQWLVLGVGLLSWMIDAVVCALVLRGVARVVRWLAPVAALAAVALVTVPLLHLAFAVQDWRISAQSAAERAASWDCGPKLLPGLRTPEDA
jgi:hypothetical protein